jgi:hypothetical protein
MRKWVQHVMMGMAAFVCLSGQTAGREDQDVALTKVVEEAPVAEAKVTMQRKGAARRVVEGDTVEVEVVQQVQKSAAQLAMEEEYKYQQN